MKMNVKKLTLFVAMFGLLTMLALPMVASAQGTGFDPGLDNIGDNIGLGDQTPHETAAKIINVVLGFLGIIAVAVILIGGFKWMTAGGNDDKVAEGRKWIVSGVIGLAIVLAAWGIAKFVLEQLIAATGANTI